MALTRLLPDRHPQRDFFIPDVFDNLPFKDDMASMESPFFTLSTRPDRRELEYTSGDTLVRVVPSARGLPTLFDKDVLLYCGSQVMEQLNKGEIPPKTLRISIHDLMVATNRSTDGHAYKRFESCLYRLRGCTVTTTIKTGDTKQVKGFGLIEDFEYLESERVKDRFIGLQITLSDWFYNSLIARQVLTINRDYFKLRRPVDRRVYEIARKHCGGSKSWSITLRKLYEKSGSLSDIKYFRASIKELALDDDLPDYRVRYRRDDDMVTFHYRGKETAVDDPQGNLLSELAPPTIPHQIPPDLLDDARKVVGEGADYYALWAEFRDWKGSKSARDMRGGFIGFCQKKVARMV